MSAGKERKYGSANFSYKQVIYEILKPDHTYFMSNEIYPELCHQTNGRTDERTSQNNMPPQLLRSCGHNNVKRYAIIRLQGYKTFFMLNLAEMKFFLLINVKMTTIVSILTFMSRKNSILGISEPEKVSNFLICSHL